MNKRQKNKLFKKSNYYENRDGSGDGLGYGYVIGSGYGDIWGGKCSDAYGTSCGSGSIYADGDGDGEWFESSSNFFCYDITLHPAYKILEY